VSAPTRYASFLVRLWREDDPGRPGRLGDWQGEVEHIQSGQQWRLACGEELLAFLQRRKEEADGPQETGE
jgi:hypothetical protein